MFENVLLVEVDDIKRYIVFVDDVKKVELFHVKSFL